MCAPCIQLVSRVSVCHPGFDFDDGGVTADGEGGHVLRKLAVDKYDDYNEDEDLDEMGKTEKY